MCRLLADKHIYRSIPVSGKIWTKDTRVPAPRLGKTVIRETLTRTSHRSLWTFVSCELYKL